MITIKRIHKTFLYSFLILFSLGFILGSVTISYVIISLIIGVAFATLPFSAPVIFIFFKQLTGSITTEETSILIGAIIVYLLVHLIVYKFLKKRKVSNASETGERGNVSNYEKFGFILLGITLTFILLLVYVGFLKSLIL